MPSNKMRFDRMTVLLPDGRQKTLSLKAWVCPPAALDFFGGLFYIAFSFMGMMYLFSGVEQAWLYFSLPLLLVAVCYAYEFKLRKQMENWCFEWQEEGISITEWCENLSGPIHKRVRTILRISCFMLVTVCAIFYQATIDVQVSVPLSAWIIPFVLICRCIALNRHCETLLKINDKNSSIIKIRR